MQSSDSTNPLDRPWSTFRPLTPACFAAPDAILRALTRIADSGAPYDLLANLWGTLDEFIPVGDDADSTVEMLARFIEASRSPTSLLALFDRDDQALPSLLQILSTSPSVAELLIGDPESFDLIRVSDGEPSSQEVLTDELTGELQTVGSASRAAIAISRFAGREVLRIAYGEFVRGLPPDRVGVQMSHLTDAILNASLQFAIANVSQEQPTPQRIDGSRPRYSIVALGNYGGQEIGYDSPLELLMLCDQIDKKNESHLQFNRSVANGLIELLKSNRAPVVSMDLRLVPQPGEENLLSDSQKLTEWTRISENSKRAIDFHDAREASVHYEREDQTWQRLAFVKARVVAGDQELGQMFLKRLEPWVYHRLLTRGEIADIRVLRRKLEKRALSPDAESGTPIADSPGGRRDIELTVQFLQILYGAEFPDVRVVGTVDAIAALSRHECLTIEEATVLSENHARLCRLENHLSVLFEHRVTHLPEDPGLRTQLAWRLGVRTTSDPDGRVEQGDLTRFEKLLSETFEVNRQIINHLMIQNVQSLNPRESSEPQQSQTQPSPGETATNPSAVAKEGIAKDRANEEVAIETELILDPDPDLNAYRDVLRGHGFEKVELAIDHLSALSHENVSFLSPRRCRHFFAAVAPDLLREISSMIAPDRTLSQLVEVTDSIGAKATLWELLSTNPATLSLMIRLCSLTPYLTGILRDNPGMIDELIDSLVMDRLPSAERLDAQTMRLCQSADDLRPILQSFKTGAHLMVGVRDLLNKESFNAIGRTLSDTAEACLRRVMEDQQEKLATRFGDPVDADGNPAEMVAIALGKLGGREPNYHSDLDLTFLYTHDGETVRRVGGPRTTLSNRQFFNQLAQNVIREMDSEQNRLFEIDLPFARGADETVLTDSMSQFLKPFRHGSAPLWQRVTLCQARPLSGSNSTKELTRETLSRAVSSTPWSASDFAEMRQLRQRSELTARPDNLKRGVGGTVDVQCIVAAGKLRSATSGVMIQSTGIVEGLEELAANNVYEKKETDRLVVDYRYLRTVEAKLRLMNTESRHELPLSDDGKADTLGMQQLTKLLDANSPDEIVQQCDEARQRIRASFNQHLTFN